MEEDLQEEMNEEALPQAEEAAPEAQAVPEERTAEDEGLTEVLTALEKRYGVEAGNREALANAIRQEDADRSARREALISRGADRLYESWMRSADETGAVYPGFELQAELKNSGFVRLLRSGVDVKTAYEVIHKDEIIPAAMQYAARTVESRLAGAMASHGHRPAENGMGSTGAVVIGSPVSSLSRRDIADIARRVERGERISFG